MKIRRPLALVLCLLLCPTGGFGAPYQGCAPTGLQLSSTPDDAFPIANGNVDAAVESNGVLYIGGDFTEVGPYTGSGVPIDA